MIFDDLPIIDVLELTSDCYKSIAAGVFISDLTVTDIKDSTSQLLTHSTRSYIIYKSSILALFTQRTAEFKTRF